MARHKDTYVPARDLPPTSLPLDAGTSGNKRRFRHWEPGTNLIFPRLSSCALMTVLWFQLGTSLSTLLEPPGRRLVDAFGRGTWGNSQLVSHLEPMKSRHGRRWEELCSFWSLSPKFRHLMVYQFLFYQVGFGWIWDLPCQWGVMIFCEWQTQALGSLLLLLGRLPIAFSSNVAPCQCFLCPSPQPSCLYKAPPPYR